MLLYPPKKARYDVSIIKCITSYDSSGCFLHWIFYLIIYIYIHMNGKINGCKYGFTYYTKRNIESKIDYLRDNFDRKDLPIK